MACVYTLFIFIIVISARRLEEMTEVQRREVLCQACTLVAEFAQHEINDRSVQDDLTHVVEQACDDLPEEMRQDVCALLGILTCFAVQIIGRNIWSGNIPSIG